MTADTTRREHSGSGIRLGIGSCPGIAKILPAGIRGITLPDGTRVRMLRCVTREGGADTPRPPRSPPTGAVHNRMLGPPAARSSSSPAGHVSTGPRRAAPSSRSPSPTCASATPMRPACCVPDIEDSQPIFSPDIVCTAGISMSISWALVFPRNRIVDGGKRFIRGLCRIP